MVSWRFGFSGNNGYFAIDIGRLLRANSPRA
jgi:hypothetical protein